MRGLLVVLLAMALAFLAGLLSAHDYLTDADRAAVREHWDDYEWAARTANVPIEALAAIHYRESNLKQTRNVGGPFMLDLGPLNDGAEFTRRIRGYEATVSKRYGYRRSATVRNDFRFAALCAAHELRSKFRGRGLADAVWGYNGRAAWYPTAKDSPYVWNDPKAGVTLTKIYRKADGTRVEFKDTRPGVMVVYLEIRRRGAE